MIEMLVALAIMAVVTAAFLPALAASSRLQRASAIENEAALAASARLEQLKAGAVSGSSEGEEITGGMEIRWSIAPVAGLGDVFLITVRANHVGDGAVVTLSEVVPDG